MQILRAITSARVIALDVRSDKLARAKEANDALTSDANAPSTVRELTRGIGADAIFDFVGSDATMQLAIGMARSGGLVAIVGLAGGRLPVGYGATPYETRLVFPFWATRLS